MVYLGVVLRLVQGTVIGAYRVEGMLGRGGMGEVYVASHVEHGRQVALKVLAEHLSADPDFVPRFQREGRMQASLEHPHVVTVYDAGESEHGFYIAMQLVPGSSLAALMSERTLPAANALRLLRQVADALDAAHAAGFVHRDVKPQNVLVGDSDDAYLGDFGLTTVGGSGGVTATGKLVGTVSYLAPEVIQGRDASPASDRYAFAATLFEALTGTVVFPRASEAAILYAHTSEPPPRISGRRSELPRELDEVFAHALAKDPAERPATATELLDAVAKAPGIGDLGPPPPPGASGLEGTTVEPGPAAVPPRPAAPAARRLVPWLAAAALAGAAVAFGIAQLTDDDDNSLASAELAPLPGTRALGSELSQPGRPVDCRGRRPGPTSSESCTIVQSGLPGRTLVVPEDGVIKRWSVRSARGEFSLAVARPRGRGAGQVARSRNEFVSNDAVNSFETNLPVEQGDVVGVIVVPGSGIGVRSGVEGATTSRWIPRLHGEDRPPEHTAGSGFDHELLLQVDFSSGRRTVPDEVTGAAAARLPRGDVRVRRKLRFSNGRPVEIRLVRVGRRFVLDQFLRGRRTARVDVPDFKPSPEATLVQMEVYAEAAPQQLGIYLEYINEESQRVLDHFYDAYPHQFDFID